MFDISLFVLMLLGALLALAVYLPLRAGQLSLATPGFYTIGGTVAALLSTTVPELGGNEQTYPLTSVFLELMLAIPLVALLAFLIGKPVLKLKGIYLAIATIALVEILRVVLLSSPWFGAAVGIFAIPQPFEGPEGYAAAFAVLLGITAWGCQRLETEPLGREMAAIRNDELAARCMGVNSERVKLISFVLSAIIAAAAGVLAAHFFNSWSARQASFDASITTLAFVVLGGSRTWLGPVIGGLVLTALPELLRPIGDLRLIVFGLVILLGPIFIPQGLIQQKRS